MGYDYFSEDIDKEFDNYEYEEKKSYEYLKRVNELTTTISEKTDIKESTTENLNNLINELNELENHKDSNLYNSKFEYFEYIDMDYVRDRFIKTKEIIAENTVSAEILDRLIDEKYNEQYDILAAVAKNSNTSIETSEKLIDLLNNELENMKQISKKCEQELKEVEEYEYNGDDKSYEENYENYSDRHFYYLAKIDELIEIKESIAENTVSKEILEKLVDDEFYDVQIAVVENPNISTETLDKLVNNQDIIRPTLSGIFHKHKPIKEAIIDNPNCSNKIIEKLASDEDLKVREYLLYHKKANTELREMIISQEKNPLSEAYTIYTKTNLSDEIKKDIYNVTLNVLEKTNFTEYYKIDDLRKLDTNELGSFLSERYRANEFEIKSQEFEKNILEDIEAEKDNKIDIEF